MFLLCAEEKSIAMEVLKINNNYELSNREKNKKNDELFHLLVFLKYKNMKYDKIIPNEPGDFIIEKDKKNIMVEVTTVFGNKDSNIAIQQMLNKLFNRGNNLDIDLNLSFDDENMKNLFLKQLEQKQNKRYECNVSINKKILLIVTSEYDNCAITGNWVLKILKSKDFNIKDSFNDIWLLDYFSSGIDNGPTIIENFSEEFKNYKNIMEGSKK